MSLVVFYLALRMPFNGSLLAGLYSPEKGRRLQRLIRVLLLSGLMSSCLGWQEERWPPAPSPPDPALPPPPPPLTAPPSPRGREGSAIPQFPWPPPKASAFAKVPRAWMIPASLSPVLQNVADHLEEVLGETGYYEKSYYAIPGGFALVLPIEQMQQDGTPTAEPDRWAIKILHPRVVDLQSYIQALFTAPVGYYRVSVWIVTDQMVTQDPVPPSRDEASKWMGGGIISLPSETGKITYSAAHETAVLIYEFEKREEADPIFNPQSRLSGRTHLEKTGVWGLLKG